LESDTNFKQVDNDKPAEEIVTTSGNNNIESNVNKTSTNNNIIHTFNPYSNSHLPNNFYGMHSANNMGLIQVQVPSEKGKKKFFYSNQIASNII
jgi:hypothetical protein